MKEYFYLYKIANLINGKIYIGVHKTMDLDDGYMGSGKLLKRAQDKYGIENFKKEILQLFDNPKDMYNAESKLVNEEFVNRDDTYNIKEGGNGGWDHLNDRSEAHINRSKIGGLKTKEIKKELFKNPEYKKNYSKIYSKAVKKSWENGSRKDQQPCSFKGRKHSEESKKKIGKANSKLLKGENNPNYGKMWISNINLKKSVLIDKNTQIPDGWVKGRNLWKKSLQKKYYCKCGKEICKSSKTCSKCLGIEYQKFNLSKNELENLLKSHSIRAIGRMFNVSDTTIRNRLKKYNLI